MRIPMRMPQHPSVGMEMPDRSAVRMFIRPQEAIAMKITEPMIVWVLGDDAGDFLVTDSDDYILMEG